MKLKERKEVYGLIDGERNYQDEKWGGDDHDSQHIPLEWLMILEDRLSEAKHRWFEEGDKGVMAEILTMAAVAVAAMEYHPVPERWETK